MKNTIRLTESAIMLAASFVLSLIPIVSMPYGGSVTLCSMLPLALIAYRHGTMWGLLVGLAGALLQLLSGLNNLSYATSAMAAVAIVMLDYIVAFTALGLCGIFRNLRTSQTVKVVGGILVACVIRYLCHVISGCTVWAGVSIPDAQGLLYSLVYNAAYMVPETIVTVVGGAAIAMTLDLQSPHLRAVEKVKTQLPSLISMLVAVVAAGVGAVLFFHAMQTEEGFDITAVETVDVITVGICAAVTAVGLILSAVMKKKG